MTTQLLTVDQVAARWQANAWTVRAEIRRGNLPAAKILGRYLISEADLSAYERQHAA